jgi:selenocysteine lyase/cysteine desulfurase
MHRIFGYCRGVAQWAAQRLSEAWGTLLVVPLDQIAFMATIELPAGVLLAAAAAASAASATAASATAAASATDPNHRAKQGAPADEDANNEQRLHQGALLKFAKGWLHRTLLDDHKIEVPVFVFEAKIYVRVSVHLYNHKAEIEQLASVVLAIAARTKSRL